jgi:hypothetical protein
LLWGSILLDDKLNSNNNNFLLQVSKNNIPLKIIS